MVWYFNDGKLPTNALKKKRSIEIFNVNYNNTGVYECVGYIRSGQFFGAKGHLHVKSKFHYYNDHHDFIRVSHSVYLCPSVS